MTTISQPRDRSVLARVLAVLACAVLALPGGESRSGPAGGTEVPPVQMLVPGFAVRALPLALKAINAVRYREDGRLMALGYDGTVYVLSDSDGDGLEDRAAVFYDPGRSILSIGMALTPPGYQHGRGVFIARKGSLVLELDSDGDDRADREIVVAKDWETAQRYPGGVSDAIGITLDKDANIYFGLESANSQNGYLLDKKTGVASYKITSERGTIQRLSADFSHRETVATGVRASVGLAINAAGDLFATDQEGATWMPNGNPFDELLHIQTARHYGFPPRHPVHLPQVIDEPSVFDYGPQHQSTCGLQFNEPVNQGPVFGPAWWRGDALVAGEARGKIYRTALVKTPAGYVARNQIIACLSWLTIDQCVSPQGDLVVTTHSGPPDWGNGPSAIGRLFKIRRTAPEPLPVLTYASSPTELRVVFDAPLTQAQVVAARSATLSEGWFVREGDRYESFRPGYLAVKRQQAAPRTGLPVQGVRLSDDQRTLIVSTRERHEALSTSIDIATWPTVSESASTDQASAQRSVLAVAADLSGVSAQWQAQDGGSSWNGWLPHADLTVARTLTAASAEHARLWESLRRPGTLTLQCQLDLWSLLRPAVQPGERIDYLPPPERATIIVTGPAGLRVGTPGLTPLPTAEVRDGVVRLTNLPARRGAWVPIEIVMPTGGGDPQLHVTWSTAEDARERPFAIRRMLVPWATPVDEPVPLVVPPELVGADRAHGEQLFTATCMMCHSIGGKGGQVGPDLSNLRYRDYASVLKDIADPNATINPDRVAFAITLRDGSSLLGVVLEDRGDELVLAGVGGPPVVLKRATIATMSASPTSLMPPGLDRALGPEGLRDLLGYLMLTPAEATHSTDEKRNP